ncbi:ABC transporter permease [Chryseolinea lacunae]|uniref:ABC transporter permease n=1 Tax=Chryseolinea lacunae TaxID=2801331 RepID=A0ABS1KKQ6_9BACT|nr:ABC transporter permease [Chryseolinea lacunae]MBL0740035.1 ABC transporter permease [Chryseolinea lacunae]
MLKNHFILAIRNLRRNKTYSLITILGLALGVACCLLLVLYIEDEVRYDAQHPQLNSLYRVVTHMARDTQSEDLAVCSPPLAQAMADELPEVTAALRLVSAPGVSENLVRFEDKTFYEPNGYMADSTLFDFFSFSFVEGTPVQALSNPNTVVITTTLAHKLFGDASALDRVIAINQGGPGGDYKITGVVKDLDHSHIQANFFISLTSSGGWTEFIRTSGEWAGQNFVPSYIKLTGGSDVQAVEKKMNDVLARHGAEAMKTFGFTKTLTLEPVKDIYLRSSVDKNPRIVYLYIVGAIATFILLIACINFINLTTARATRRATEIGVRKVMGAFRGVLIRQLLAEAMLVVVVAVIISLIILEITLPGFNTLVGKSISLQTMPSLSFLFTLLAITLLTGLLAGSYPAFYLTSFSPAVVLKNKMAVGSSGSLRKGLVVFQFSVAIVLVCGMIMVSQQLSYIREKELGFDAKAKVIVPLRTDAARKAYATLKQAFQQQPAVKKLSGADYLPGQYWNDIVLFRPGKTREEGVGHFMNNVAHDLNDVLNIRLTAGRPLSPNLAGDQGKIIINEASAKALGFTPTQAIGQRVEQSFFKNADGTPVSLEIVGVMQDFHRTSLHDPISPAFFMAPSLGQGESFSNVVLDVRTESFAKTIEGLKADWNKIVSDAPFEYSFLDQSLQQQYTQDQKASTIITTFTVVAFMLCCLGLYGLSSYVAERRVKEIGVRKVMGASVQQIVTLMSSEFMKPVCIAIVLAVPVAWYAIDKWLEGFAYKTPLSVFVFIAGALIALSVAWLTVSFESLRAALRNPADALRNE